MRPQFREASNDESKRMRDFEHYLFPHMDRLYGLALTLTRNHHDAEDLVQTTYLRAWRAFDTFVPGDFKKWVTTILFNGFINLSRKSKRSPYLLEIEAVKESVIPREDFSSFDDDLEGFFGDEVSNALEGLPDKYRTVVLLCDVAGLHYKEIAGAVSTPIGTVMSRLHRARKMLADNLRSYAASEYGYA
jgi:RNA polymerase sigma-70 factor (ECF subfamily)